MTLDTPKSGSHPDLGAGAPLDRLLRRFFLAEMPSPWPVMPVPASESAPRSRPAARPWWFRSRSRLALAASVGLLMVGSWNLAGSVTDYPPPATGVGADSGLSNKNGDPARNKNANPTGTATDKKKDVCPSPTR